MLFDDIEINKEQIYSQMKVQNQKLEFLFKGFIQKGKKTKTKR